MVALAIAYQVQCRLSDEAPVRAAGFDHTTQGAYAVAAGVSRALALDEAATANAIAICGTAFNALRVTRTGGLSHGKGLHISRKQRPDACGQHFWLDEASRDRWKSSKVTRGSRRRFPDPSPSTGPARTWSA